MHRATKTGHTTTPSRRSTAEIHVSRIDGRPVDIDPELSTSDEVQGQAFNELAGVVGNRLPSGSIDIVPTFIPPGYAYPVEEFETVDGEVPSKVLEKVAYSEGYGQDAQGSLRFKTPRNWVSGLSPVENDVIGIKRLF